MKARSPAVGTERASRRPDVAEVEEVAIRRAGPADGEEGQPDIRYAWRPDR
jgi:hypothetical protein